MWIILAFCSAIGLGFYDICKKNALHRMQVVRVLTGSVVCSSLILLPWLLFSRLAPQEAAETVIYVPHVSWEVHGYIFLKSCIVLSSWICAYYAMRRLPITVVTPINATRPMWTLLGALLIFGEVLNPWQWSGVVVAIVSFFAFAMVSIDRHAIRRREQSPVPYLMLMAAVLLGAASGLYDKYLMHHFNRNAVLVYYTLYQALLMLVVYRFMQRRSFFRSFHFESSYYWVIGVSVFLIAADFVYLWSLSCPGSLIAVVSLIRRSSVLIAFFYGAMFLREKHIVQKTICLCGIFIAMILLLLGSL